MRRFCVIITAFLAITNFSSQTLADTPLSITLSTPPMLAQDSCKVPIWSDAQFIWKGIIDKRPSPEIGLQTQKGKEPIPVMADPPLSQVLDKSLYEIFTACGMKLAENGPDTMPTLSAEIREFYTGVEKKLLTGKSKAKSSIAFTLRKGGQSTSVTVGFEIDSKKIRSGSTKQLQQTLNELLVETLRQIPATPEMRELK